MFAIVVIAGFQEKVEKGTTLQVQTLEANVGDTVTFDKVLLMSEDGKTAVIGKPYVEGAKVTATIKEHGRGDKIMVRKFKRRKRYFKTITGHRQNYTEIEVTEVTK